MKRTSVVTLIVLTLLGVVGAGLLQALLASSGRPIITAPVTLPVALAAIGAILITLALPIRQMTRGARPREQAARFDSARRPAGGPVDPLYATRVVMLAKASALSGALLTGAGVGVILYLLSRPVGPAGDVIGGAIAALVGAAVLLACGLIAESMCRIPPRDDDEDDDGSPVRASP